MIVVAIIGILAAIAIPSFRDFVKKSHTAEVRMNSKGMLSAERVYFADHNAFIDTDKNPSSIPAGTKLPWDVSDSTWQQLGFDIAGGVRYQYRIHGNPLHVHAHGNLDGDATKSTYRFYIDGTEQILDPLE
jgi:type II secretory pathway pseudopilin PulG